MERGTSLLYPQWCPTSHDKENSRGCGAMPKNPTPSISFVASPLVTALVACTPFDRPRFGSEIMEQAADKMFTSTADFLRTELNSAVDDFQLLQDMNKAAIQKYKDLTKTTQAIGGALEALEDQYKDLAPVLAQIDNIEENVTNLEQAVFKLDSYCKQLEQKLKSLETK